MLVVVAVALTLGLVVPGSEMDLSQQSISVPTPSTVGSACVKNGAMRGELAGCSRISAGTLFEVGRGIVPGRRSVPNPGVSIADIVRVQSPYIGSTDALNLLADPTSLLLVGTTLAGLGVVLRRLRRRRAMG